MDDSEKLDFIYQTLLEWEKRRSGAAMMSKQATTRIIGRLIELADADDFAGCLESWEALEQDEMIWINQHMDSINRRKVGNAIDQAKKDRGDFIQNEVSEKDARREQIRRAL